MMINANNGNINNGKDYTLTKVISNSTNLIIVTKIWLDLLITLFSIVIVK